MWAQWACFLNIQTHHIYHIFLKLMNCNISSEAQKICIFGSRRYLLMQPHLSIFVSPHYKTVKTSESAPKLPGLSSMILYGSKAPLSLGWESCVSPAVVCGESWERTDRSNQRLAVTSSDYHTEWIDGNSARGGRMEHLFTRLSYIVHVTCIAPCW